MKRRLRYSIVIQLLFIVIVCVKPRLVGAKMSSDSYRIDMGNFNMTSGKKTSTTYRLTDTAGQTAPGRYSSTGYLVRAGFQYIYSIIPFTFSISDTSIDLGTLLAETSSTQSANLTVSCGGAGGYQVTAIENNPLRNANNTEIPDTICNGGGSACTESAAAVWSSNSAFGFGYNMQGTDIPVDFVDSTYFRPFPSAASSENPTKVMEGTNVGRSLQSSITFKANISGLQAAGNYRNVIKFTATPKY